jgi:ankyrin repeat protein
MRVAIDGASLPSLHRVAFETDLATLRRLLESGADPNEPGCVRDECDGWSSNPGPSYIATPLMLAAVSTRPDATAAIRILLDAGADPRALSTRGDFALWFAVVSGNIHGMRAPLEHGAPPNVTRGNGATPICEAAALANVNAVRLLLHFGASPHPVAKDNEDVPVEPAYSFRIPLFAAAKGGSAECARLLIDAGARVTALDIHGETPLGSWWRLAAQSMRGILGRCGSTLSITQPRMGMPRSCAP